MKIKGFKKPKASCSCCELKYTYSEILGGLTVSLIKRDYPDVRHSIDIPFSELENLKLLIDHILNTHEG